MNYFVFTICWSQTDHEKIIVKANDREQATLFIGKKYNVGKMSGAHHVIFVCSVHSSKVFTA